MVEKRQLVQNALASIIQVVVVGATFFFLYRFLLDEIGETAFGVWAVVLATTSAGSIANLGLAGGSTKYVSKYLARGDTDHVRAIVETASTSVGCILGILLISAYPVFRIVLSYIIENESSVSQAYLILPYALGSFWLTSISLVFQASLDGLHRVDLRGLVLSISAIFYLVLAYLLVPQRGLVGVAQAQLVQSALLFLLSWILLKREFRNLPVLPVRWSKSVFVEMFSYSANLQVISFFRILSEPATGALLSKFGGVGSVAYYEMARRMVVQLRALFVTAHRALVPTISGIHEQDPDQVQKIYSRSFQILAFLIAPTLPFLIGLVPFISEVWVGYYNSTFVAFSILLSLGWFLNMLGNPAYYANVGTGDLRWNVISHIVNGVLNLALGALLGWALGGIGVVIGFVVALLIASALVAVAYERRYQVGMAHLVQRETLLLVAAGLLGMAAMYWIHAFTGGFLVAVTGAGMLLAYAVVILIPLWRHPLRADFAGWLGMLISGRREPIR